MEITEQQAICDWGTSFEIREKTLKALPSAYMVVAPNADAISGVLFMVIAYDMYGSVEGERNFVRVPGSDWHDNCLNAWEDAFARVSTQPH